MILNITGDGVEGLPLNTVEYHVVISGVFGGATLSFEIAGEDGLAWLVEATYTSADHFTLRCVKEHDYRFTVTGATGTTNINVSYNELGEQYID